MLSEEWNNHFQKILTLSHDITIEMFAVVIAALIDEHRTYPEEITKIVQALDAFCTLSDCEFVEHLVTSFVSFSIRSTWLSHDTEGEAEGIQRGQDDGVEGVG